MCLDVANERTKLKMSCFLGLAKVDVMLLNYKCNIYTKLTTRYIKVRETLQRLPITKTLLTPFTTPNPKLIKHKLFTKLTLTLT